MVQIQQDLRNYLESEQDMVAKNVYIDQFICLNKKTIQWKEDMTLPILFKRNLEFQFFPPHQFGYDPEEIDSVGYAKATIQNYKIPYVETNVKNSAGKTIGRLYFEFAVINDNRLQKNLIRSQTLVTVFSMLVHLNKYYGSRGYIQLQMNQETTYTPQISLVAGQLLWAEQLSLPISGSQNKNIDFSKMELIIRIIIQENIIGEVSIPLVDIKEKGQKLKKIPIISVQNGQQCGILFIQVNLRQKKNQGSELFQPSNRSKKSKSTKSTAFLPVFNHLKQSITSQKETKPKSKSKSTKKIHYQIETQQSTFSKKPPITKINQYQQRIRTQVNKMMMEKLLLKKMAHRI